MSSNLVSVQNGQATTTSLQIAAKFGKRHDNILRKIETLECSKEFTRLNFAVSDYIDESGKTNKAYKITYDGFVFLAMGFTGATAAKFKEDYIAAFRTMEQHLLDHLATSGNMVNTQPAPLALPGKPVWYLAKMENGAITKMIKADVPCIANYIATHHPDAIVINKDAMYENLMQLAKLASDTAAQFRDDDKMEQRWQQLSESVA